MNTVYRYLGILVLGFLFGQQGFAQEIKTKKFYEQIKNYDLSVVLAPDSIFADEELMIERAEILGFIGNDYQRFHIHFISIIQNPENPYEYFAYGKTKVKENICEFQGIIKIVSAETYNDPDFPKYTRGFTICELVFYEDKKQAHTGFFKGNLRSDFLIDDKGTFRYDAIMFVADGFSNNQFTGNWTSYKTKTSKKCNWGDYRIPESNDLDIGAGEFSVDEKYVKNGWENYRLLWLGNYNGNSPESQKALKKEREKWWK
jgi:hypothetical protein